MVEVLGIPLYERNIASAVAELKELCQDPAAPRANRCVSATGAHGLVFARKNPEFRKILQHFFWNLPDGMPAVWVGRAKGARQMDRCYGPDFMADTLRGTAGTGIRHFFCGGQEGVADQLRDNAASRFGNRQVVGTFCPPFREIPDEELQELAQAIDAAKADVLWVGLSTPKQEIFAHRLARFTHVHFLITVGAAFDFHTDRVRQAPRRIQRLGLEWFFRLCMEPRRLFRRYAEIVPLFILYNVREWLSPNRFRKS
jgi:N-acetylglucosaminyldiphosphoundecaprenol N-acetyl-beta-D-mannosaminyltransferase